MNLQSSVTGLGYAGKVLALRMGCTGDGKIRRVNRYASNAPSVIQAECDIAQACGVSGFVHIWDGTVDAFINSSMQAMWAECEKRGLLFALMLDQWIARNQRPNPTTATIAQIKSAAAAVLASSCYLPERYILEFNLAGAGVNIEQLQAAFPSNPILSEGSGFSWPQIPPQTAKNVPVMALCPFFNDGGRPDPNGINPPWPAPYARNWSASYWGSNTTPNRVNDHQGGNYWMDQLANIAKTTPYLMIATWDDFEESTAVLQYLSAMCCIRVA